MSGISTLWEDIDLCYNQYRCASVIYLMSVLLSSYGIVMNREINATGHGNNVVDGINTTERRYLKGEIKLIGKLASDDTTNIGMLTSASKDVSIKFADKCIHMINIKDRLNGIKGSKISKRKNNYSNINNIYKMFKGNLMLITEV